MGIYTTLPGCFPATPSPGCSHGSCLPQLVHSALLFDFPELRGPSFESSFLLLHRYYNKRVVSVDFSPPFNIIDIDDISTETLTNVLEEDAGSTALLIKARIRTLACLKGM